FSLRLSSLFNCLISLWSAWRCRLASNSCSRELINPRSASAFQAFTCSTYRPFARQYSLNSASFKLAVSSTVANLASADQCSEVGLLPGTGRPCCLALSRQLYKVCSPIPSILDTSATVIFEGGNNLLKINCLRSSL